MNSTAWRVIAAFCALTLVAWTFFYLRGTEKKVETTSLGRELDARDVGSKDVAALVAAVSSLAGTLGGRLDHDVFRVVDAQLGELRGKLDFTRPEYAPLKVALAEFGRFGPRRESGSAGNCPPANCPPATPSSACPPSPPCSLKPREGVAPPTETKEGVVVHRIRDPTNDDIDNAWCSVHPDALFCKKKHLVITQWDEDLTWLHEIYPDWSYTLYNHRNDTSINHLAPNQGQEAHGYLRFIVDHYDNLPELTIFLQGMPHWDVFVTLFCLPKDVYFTSVTDFYCPNREHVANGQQNIINIIFGDGWRRTDDLRMTSHYCCGQFAASRRAIRDRPLEFWKRALWVAQQNFYDKTGCHFEEVWHVIFNEDAVMKKYEWCDRFPCYCNRTGLPKHPWLHVVPIQKFYDEVWFPYHQTRVPRMVDQEAKRFPRGLKWPPTDFNW